MIIYTSGTTALPKGVLHSQRAPVIQSLRFAELMDLVPEDRVWSAQPFFWTAGIAMSLGATLAAGACLILQQGFEAEAALDLLESEAVTAAHAWPHQEKAMADSPSAARRDLSALRRIEFTSPLAPLAGIEKDEWGTHCAYGLSETFTLVSSLPARAPAGLRQASSGRPLPGVRLQIVDPTSGAPVPSGQEGEIAVQGETFMRGYYKVEPESYLDSRGYFRTGDGGHLDDSGLLHWSGRLSNLIKTGGANVSPLEIEEALGSHPQLRACQAVGVPHPSLGEVVVLCAVPSGSGAPSEEAILGSLRDRLAAYKLPRRVLFFDPEDLALTGSQKIQIAPLRHAALRRLEAEGALIAGHLYAAEPA